VLFVADYPGTQPDETMGTAAVSGAAAGDYALTADTCSGAHVRASCRITVAFRPTAVGVRDATLTLPGHNGTVQVALSAIGYATGRGLAVQPSSLAFAPLFAGGLSPAGAVTVTNAGDLPASVVALRLGGEEPQPFSFGTQDCLGSALAPGSTCSVAVRFTAPPVLGPHRAQLEVACGPGCATASVALAAQTQPTPGPLPVPTPTPGSTSVQGYWTLDLGRRIQTTRTGVVVTVTSYPKLYVIIRVFGGRKLLAVRRPSVLGTHQYAVPVSGLRRGRVYTVTITAGYKRRTKTVSGTFLG
jgi:hypothetical protein